MKKLLSKRPVRVLARLVQQYFEDGVARSAAELAYYLLFSLFPSLIIINNVLSRLNINAEELLRSLNIVLPAEIVGIFTDYLDYISGQDSDLLLASGLFITIYMVSRALRSLMRSVTRAYRMERKGPGFFVLSFALSAVLMLSIFLFLVIMVIGSTLLDKLGEYVTLSDQFISVINLLSYIVAPVFLFVLLALFYDFVGGKRYSFTMALPGAIFFAVIWTVATLFFSFYVANMSNYSLLYGSLGAIMILMLWLYLTGILLILGGVFNRVLAEELGRVKPE